MCFLSADEPDLGFERKDYVKVFVKAGGVWYFVTGLYGDTTPDEKCIFIWFDVPAYVTSIQLKIVFFNTGKGETWKIDNIAVCKPKHSSTGYRRRLGIEETTQENSSSQSYTFSVAHGVYIEDKTQGFSFFTTGLLHFWQQVTAKIFFFFRYNIVGNIRSFWIYVLRCS